MELHMVKYCTLIGQRSCKEDVGGCQLAQNCLSHYVNIQWPRCGPFWRTGPYGSDLWEK